MSNHEDFAIPKDIGPEQIPCDIKIAPATYFRKGCRLDMVLRAIERRRGESFEHTTFGPHEHPHDLMDDLANALDKPPGVDSAEIIAAIENLMADRNKLRYKERVLQMLVPYIRHHVNCPGFESSDRPCICGLKEHIKDIP
jgi:hypothetical protein